MTRSPDRSAQRARTRQAILDGARKLLFEGKTVTVAAAAAEMGVSKATSYRYFSDPSVLVAEAVLDVDVDSYEAIVAGQETLRGKLRAICLYFFDLSVTHEAGFRQFMAAAMTAWKADSPATARGGRRVKMFRRALGEHETGLSKDARETLVQALTVSTGVEAMIALLDIARTDVESARQTVAFMADALVDRAVGKAG